MTAQSLTQSHRPITDRSYPDIVGTVMGFDFGEKRIGVATGETLLKSSHALTTIQTESNEARFSEIALLIKEWKPSLLIVGLPSHLDGSEHMLTQLCKRFAQRLEGRFNLPVMMIDERLSSVEASSLLNDANVTGRAQKGMIDAVAAQVILQSYFNQLTDKKHATP